MHHFPRACWLVLSLAWSFLIAGPGLAATPVEKAPQQQVWQAEQEFAQTMATRNLTRFANFVAEEAIFINGASALRGKAKVLAHWAAYFKEKDAPFSWQPDQVEVLESGKLALSTGLVRDPQGKVLGRFNSIWRLEADGKWRVVFDKGSPASPAEQQSQSQCCGKAYGISPVLRQLL